MAHAMVGPPQVVLSPLAKPPDIPSKSFVSVLGSSVSKAQETIPIKTPWLWKGEPAIAFTDDEMAALNESFKLALIGKFSDDRPLLKDIRRFITSLGLKANFSAGLLDQKHILLRFVNEEDTNRLWLREQWSISGYPMRVFRWSPEFRNNMESSVAPVWVTMPNLPVQFFRRDSICSIARSVGQPIMVDQATTNLTRPSQARICVEIDLLKEPAKRVWIKAGADGFWQQFIYESIPQYCSHCYRQGHSKQNCKIIHPDTVQSHIEKRRAPRDELLKKQISDRGKTTQVYKQVTRLPIAAVEGEKAIDTTVTAMKENTGSVPDPDTMSWWYRRSIGEVEQKKHHIHANGDLAVNYKSVALIVGVTGIAGSGLAETLSYPDTPGGPWKVYGVARRPGPEWLTNLHVDYIKCDIAKTEETYSKLSPLKDITHVFYVSWTGSEDCQLNSLMFQNILDAVIPNAPNLKHVGLQTGIKYYWGNMAEMDSTNQPHDCPFYENLPRLKQDNFYYNLEDMVSEAAVRKGTISFSIHRPALIFGFSPCSMMNTVSTLCVYAAICKHENKPLVYTGTEVSWTCLWDAVDSDLLAEHFLWASTDPKAKNQAFNVNNGDVFKWKHMWNVLAREFEIEAVGFEGKEPVLLEDLMKDKDSVWDEIVKKHDLSPTRLRDIAAFWLADVVFRNKETLCSMNKNKEFGFLGFRDTTKSFVNSIRKMREFRFIP